MRSFIKYFLFALVMFCSGEAYAAPTYPGGPQDPRDAIDQFGDVTGVPKLEVTNTTYFKLCEIRRFFCGKVKTVMVAAAVFIVGLLVIIGKMTWTRLIIIMSGVVIFSSAEYITTNLTTLPPNLGVIYSCYCKPWKLL